MLIKQQNDNTFRRTSLSLFNILLSFLQLPKRLPQEAQFVLSRKTIRRLQIEQRQVLSNDQMPRNLKNIVP